MTYTPAHEKPIDCVVVGHNDLGIRSYAAAVRPSHSRSAAYSEVLTNSVVLRNEHYSYMDLFNVALAGATGKNYGLSGFRAPSLGACYLVNFMAKRGYHGVLVNAFKYETERFEALLAQAPRAVAITTTFYFDPEPVEEIVAFVRERSPSTRIVVGGPYVYAILQDHGIDEQEYIFDRIGADAYVVDSQGEATLVAILEQLLRTQSADLTAVRNLIVSYGGRYVRTGVQRENNQLEEADIDWSLIDHPDVSRATFMRTARSCPFKCNFCTFPVMAGEHIVADLTAIERELDSFHRCGGRYIGFVDDTFNVPLPRFKALLRMMIRKKYDFQWISYFRCSNADEEAFDLMQQSGCLGVLLGIESGDPGVLKTMNKFAQVDRYRSGIAELKKRNIMTYALFIVGFPGETEQSARNTMEFIESAAPTFFMTQTYFHTPRNPISQRAFEFRLQGMGYSWSHRTMTWKDAAALVRETYRAVSSSTILPLWEFNLWTLPYLMTLGYDADFFRRFLARAQPMLLKSMNGAAQDLEDEERGLVRLFADAGAPHVLGPARLAR